MSTEIIKHVEIARTASIALEENNARVEKAKAGIAKFKESIVNGYTPELVTNGEALVKKINRTITLMNDKRTPITQALSFVSKEFTTAEADLKVLGDEIKKGISAHKNELLRIQQEKERLESIEAAKRAEFIIKAAEIKAAIYAYAIEIAKNKISAINTLFTSMQLNGAAQQTDLINNFSIEYTSAIHSEYKDNYSITSSLLNKLELDALVLSAIDLTYTEYKTKCESYLDQQKKEVVSRIPARIEELKRLHDLAITNKKEADRQAEVAKKKQKEDAESALKLAEESKKEVGSSIKGEVAAEQMQQSFEASATKAAVPQMDRKGYSIEILNTAAFAQIFQLWYRDEGCKLEANVIEKRTLKQMKTYCEKLAHKKDGEKLVSEHLIYHEVAK